MSVTYYEESGKITRRPKSTSPFPDPDIHAAQRLPMPNPSSSAFPIPASTFGHQHIAPKFGMTIREYTAIKIMAALPLSADSHEDDAQFAVARADALLAELNK